MKILVLSSIIIAACIVYKIYKRRPSFLEGINGTFFYISYNNNHTEDKDCIELYMTHPITFDNIFKLLEENTHNYYADLLVKNKKQVLQQLELCGINLKNVNSLSKIHIYDTMGARINIINPDFDQKDKYNTFLSLKICEPGQINDFPNKNPVAVKNANNI